MTSRLVLDTNVYSFAPVLVLARLAERGLLLSVSEVAFTEALARSVREYRSGMGRERARGKFFGRAKSLAPYMNSQCRVALGAGGITHRVAAMTQGRPPPRMVDERAALLNEMWGVAVGSEYPDQLWIECARVAEEWLTWRDETLRLTVRTMRERAKPARWSAMRENDALAAMRASLARFLGFSEAMTERLDAHVATVAYRMRQGELGNEAKENDGADLHMTQHLAEDCIVVTEDEGLINIVDRAGTYQTPWVRRLDDLDDLPEGLPWGESARRLALAFNRKPRQS